MKEFTSNSSISKPFPPFLVYEVLVKLPESYLTESDECMSSGSPETFAMEARSLLASDWVGVVSNCTIGLD